MIANPTPMINSSQAPTPTFVLGVENLEPITITQGVRRRRDNETSRDPLAKSKSHVVRSLIEEDVDVNRSATLG